MKRACLCGLLLVFARFVCAGEADVLGVDVHCNGESVCRFSVTVRHADQGREHFADRWEILDTRGNVIAVRELAHPHDDEQPFTRSLDNVTVPDGITRLMIRAHDSVHQYGGRELAVDLRDVRGVPGSMDTSDQSRLAVFRWPARCLCFRPAALREVVAGGCCMRIICC